MAPTKKTKAPAKKAAVAAKKPAAKPAAKKAATKPAAKPAAKPVAKPAAKAPAKVVSAPQFKAVPKATRANPPAPKWMDDALVFAQQNPAIVLTSIIAVVIGFMLMF